jgi:hypothetical protein
VYATARRPDSIAAPAAKGATTLALDVTDEASMSAAVAQVSEAEDAWACSSTTPATASPAPSRASRWTRFPTPKA